MGLSTATRLLLGAAMVQLLVGALSGLPMALVRQRPGAPPVPKYLAMVHTGGLMHGPILATAALGISVSTLASWIDTTAAVLLAVASVLLTVKDTVNWRQEVADEFAENSLGLKFGQLFGPVHLLGLILAAVCTASGIV